MTKFMKTLRKQLGTDYLKKVLPFYIEQKNNKNIYHRKDTYLLNIYNEYIHLNMENIRDNKYINLNIQNLSDIREDFYDFKRELLLNYSDTPWENKTNLNKLRKKLCKKRHNNIGKDILDINIEFLFGCCGDGIKMNDIKDIHGYNHLRKNIPYSIDINTNSNEAYLINRDYEYIDLDTKNLSDIRKDPKDFKREYLFKDETAPWNNEDNLKKIIIELKKYSEETQILNMNEKLKNLMAVCD
jgi:hypothetical protein